MMRLVARLCDGLPAPLVVHIMDDWPSTIYDQGLLGPWLRSTTDRTFRRLIRCAAATFAISRRMADVYEERYGGAWEVFHNPVDISRWSAAARRDWSRGGVFRLVYAGRVGQGIGASLVDVCRAVEQLRRQGEQVLLDIFTPSLPAAAALGLAAYDGVSIRPAVEDADMPAVLAAADLLVLPYDFTGRAAAFACLSYPTKAPAYMATGVPVLVYAPRDHALALDARGRGWASVVDVEGVGGLTAAIEGLVRDEGLRRSLAATAMATCERLHDADVVTARFRAALVRAALRG
jgi:glycosyltransferase involved in cell wall biosynthesis